MTYNAIDPTHYHGDRRIEPIDVIEDWNLNYRLGNALKYISRNGRKPGEDPAEGLQKAIWYLNREIDALQGKSNYAVTYEDILEDYAICAAQDASFQTSLQSEYDAWNELDDNGFWDPTIGPQEPTAEDYLGDAEWDSTDSKSEEVKPESINKAFDEFEENEIVSTFERRNLIFGVCKNGYTYILGSTGTTD